MPSWDFVHESSDLFSACSSDCSDDLLIGPCNDNLDANYYSRTDNESLTSVRSVSDGLPNKRGFFSPGVRRFLQVFLILYSTILTMFLCFSSFKSLFCSSIFSRFILPKLDFSLQRFQILDFTNDGGSFSFNVSLNDELFTSEEASYFKITANCVSLSYNKHDQLTPLVKFYPQSTIIVQNSSLDSGIIHFQVFENSILDLFPQNSNNLPMLLIENITYQHDFSEGISNFNLQVENLTLHYNPSILSHFIPMKLIDYYSNYNSFSQTNFKTFTVNYIEPREFIKKLITLFKVEFLNISNNSKIQLQDILNFRILNYDYSLEPKNEKYTLTTGFDTEITLFNNSKNEIFKLPDFTFNKFKFDLLIPSNNGQHKANKFSEIIIEKFALQKPERKFNLSMCYKIPQISDELLSINHTNSRSILNSFVSNLLSPVKTENYIYLKNSLISNNPFWISRILEKITISVNLNEFLPQLYDEILHYMKQNTSSYILGVQVLLESLVYLDFSFLDLEFLGDINNNYADVLMLKNSITSSTWALNNQSDSNGNLLNNNFLNYFLCNDIKGNFTIAEINTLANFSNIETDLICITFGGTENFQSLSFTKELVSEHNSVSLNYNITSHNNGVIFKILDPKKINRIFHHILNNAEMGENKTEKVISQFKLKLFLDEFTMVNFDFFDLKHSLFKDIIIPLKYNLTIKDLKLLKSKLKSLISLLSSDEDKNPHGKEGESVGQGTFMDNLFEIDTVDYLSSSKDSITLKANIHVFTPSNWSSDAHYLRVSTGSNSSINLDCFSKNCNSISDVQNAMRFLRASNCHNNENNFLQLDYFTNPNDNNIQLGFIILQNFEFDSTLNCSNISIILNLDPFLYCSQNDELQANYPITISPQSAPHNYHSDVKEIVRKFVSDIISNNSPTLNLSFTNNSSFANSYYLSESLANLSFLVQIPGLQFSDSDRSKQKSPQWSFFPPQLGATNIIEKEKFKQKAASSLGNGIILNVIFHLMSSEVQLLLHNPILNLDIHIIILEAETMYMKPLSFYGDNGNNNDIDLLPLAHLATYPIIELNIPANTNYLTPRLGVVFEKRALRVLKDALSHGISSINIVSKSFFLLKVQYFEIGLNYTGTGITADIIF